MTKKIDQVIQQVLTDFLRLLKLDYFIRTIVFTYSDTVEQLMAAPFQ
jgi:hypothetical protein